MDYTFARHEDVTSAVRRVAHVQVEAALADLRRPDATGVVEAVHDCRKRCKKLRGLVRLVRPALGKRYRPANTAFRDAARALSDYRDAHALLATFDDLVVAAAAQLPDGGLGPVRAGLAERAVASTEAVSGRSDLIERAEELITAGAARIDDWTLDDDGWDAIAGGLAKTYGRGVDALASVRRSPSPGRSHEWRKRAKYTWYHLRLLECSAPSILTPTSSLFHDLSDALGDSHDLAVLTDQLRTDPASYGGDEVVGGATVLVEGYRQQLEHRALLLGVRLYAESPERFTKRLGRYWAAWHELGDEEPAGELSDLFGPDDGLADLTVAELRSLARDAQVAGRSGLPRDDLVAALRAAGVTGP